MRLYAPPVPEQAGGDKNSAWNQKGQAELGTSDIFATILFQELVNGVIKTRSGLRADEISNSKREVIKPSNADRLMVTFSPDGRRGSSRQCM